MRISSVLVTLASWLVPSDQRADWRREWLAELHARPPGLASLRLAAGAPLHAMWLRLEPWRPGLLWTDLRSSWSFLRRRPGFAWPLALTLAIGIGATTAGFSVVYGVLLKPLPYRDPAQLVQLWETNPRFNWTEANVAPGNLVSWRERQSSFTDIACYYGTADRSAMLSDLTLDGDTPVRARVQSTSANFFSVLGVEAAIGRTFAPGEDQRGRHRVAILADAFWRRHFGADPDVVGRSLVLNGIGFNVIGVMPRHFRFDTPETEFWIPLVLDWNEAREVRRPHYLRAIARLEPGVGIDQARAELSKIAADLEREHPDTNAQMGAGLGPLDDWFVGPSRRPLLLLFAAMALILASACANVTTLLLARTRERFREMSLRAALGANRLRLTRQILFETLLVAGAGTLVGLGLSAAGVRVLLGGAPAGIPRQDEIAFDPVVWAFAALLGLITTVAVGILPAMRLSRGDLRAAIAGGARSTSVEGHRLHRSFVAVQVALAAVLLGSAAMTLRSVQALKAVDPGFSLDGLTTARISLGTPRYRPAGRAAAFFDDLGRRLREVPGITGAGATARLPLEGASWTGTLFIEADPSVKGTELRHKSVTPGYLEAIGHRLIAGRLIESGDRADAPLVVVINETMKRTYFPGADPVGQRVAWDAPGPNVRWRTIVGVVSDERQDGLGVPVRPEVFDSAFQEGFSSMAIAVRSTVPAARAVAEIRRAAREIDPQVSVFDAGAFADRVDRSTHRERMAAWLVAVFAIIGMALSGVGTYSIVARAVAARTREIGVRVACGATATEVFRLIVRDHLGVALVGLAAGVPLVLITARALVTVLYGVRPIDPPSVTAALAVPLLVATAASLVPARRALRVDPVSALKAEG